MVLEPVSPRSTCWHGRVLLRQLFLVYRWLASWCVLTWQRQREREKTALCCLPLGALIPPWGPHPPRPHRSLIASQRLHFLKPSHEGLEHQHMSLGTRHKHSVHNRPEMKRQRKDLKFQKVRLGNKLCGDNFFLLKSKLKSQTRGS